MLERGANMHANRGKIRDCGNVGKVQTVGFRKEQRRKNRTQNGTRERGRKLTGASCGRAGGLASDLQGLTPFQAQEDCLGLSPLPRGRA